MYGHLYCCNFFIYSECLYFWYLVLHFIWYILFYFIFYPFRLILIAEKDTVYSKFPTPLINRLEKHFVLTSSILEKWQGDLLEIFTKWIFNFSRYLLVVRLLLLSTSICIS